MVNGRAECSASLEVQAIGHLSGAADMLNRMGEKPMLMEYNSDVRDMSMISGIKKLTDNLCLRL